MPQLKASPAATRRALQAANLREDIHTFTVLRRRVSLMLTGELTIPTRATPDKLRAQLAELDADILRLRIDLNALATP